MRGAHVGLPREQGIQLLLGADPGERGAHRILDGLLTAADGGDSLGTLDLENHEPLVPGRGDRGLRHIEFDAPRDTALAMLDFHVGGLPWARVLRPSRFYPYGNLKVNRWSSHGPFCSLCPHSSGFFDAQGLRRTQDDSGQS